MRLLKQSIAYQLYHHIFLRLLVILLLFGLFDVLLGEHGDLVLRGQHARLLLTVV